MGAIADFNAFQTEVQEALVAVTRTTGKLSAEDLGFQRSLNREVGPALDEQSERVLSLANALLKSAASIADLRVPSILDVEDVDNDWRGVIDVVDALLEKADTALYEYTGVIKRLDNTNIESSTSKSRRNTTSANPLRTQNLVKPQLAFDVKPDNFNTSPWKPLLSTKPHATLSLEQSLGTIRNEYDQEQYRHPYETEIQHLQYPKSVYEKAEPIPYLPVDTTSAVFVDTEEGVLEMLEELKTATEIAVDLEHHDARSHVGLVSLMQISTRNKDWIVDTLKPWRQKLEVLNEVFADPNIVKVFHGAYMDIVWLQRDLGLYVVGLFDTHYASRSLGYAGGSLAFLLKKFINFDADKKYQLADWRIRPLPEEMFFYARSDTHFLLYIYDNMRNELIDKTNKQTAEDNKLDIVLQKSKETSLLRYERPVYHAESGKGPGGWWNLLVKSTTMFSNEQFAVFRAVHEWRDRIAREDDDGAAFVMPNHVIFSIAKHLPQDQIALFGVAHPVSHSVKSRGQELLDLIKEAQANSHKGPSMLDVLRPDSVGATVKASLPPVAISKESTPLSSFPEVDETELRSNRSSFWGGAFGSSIWETPTSLSDRGDSVKLAIPFPALASEVIPSTASTPIASSPQVKTATTPHSPTPEISQAFTLRRAPKDNASETPAKKRRSEAISADNAAAASTPASNSISLEASSESEDQDAAAHRLRKEEKRRAKAEKKALKQQQKLEAEIDEEEPFDYSTAPKVTELDKIKKEKRKNDKRTKRDGKGQKVEEEETAGWDPYKKSMDAGKGMRRVQSERAGRSGIFKN